jgi:hypothetical protein
MILTTLLALPCIESDNSQNIQYIKNFQISSLEIFLAIQKTISFQLLIFIIFVTIKLSNFNEETYICLKS